MKKPTLGKGPKLSVRETVVPCQPLKRVSYFTGQMLSADDFTAEQDYHLNQHRRHNRLCHGVGVVQGLKVSVAKDSSGGAVVVEPGFAIDPVGNEIQLCDPVRLPLGACRVPIYVLLRFKEISTNPVPAPTGSTGGEEDGVVYSRIEEGYEVLLSPDVQGQDCAPAVLPLARLVRIGKAWQVDKKYKTPRAH